MKTDQHRLVAIGDRLKSLVTKYGIKRNKRYTVESLHGWHNGNQVIKLVGIGWFFVTEDFILCGTVYKQARSKPKQYRYLIIKNYDYFVHTVNLLHNRSKNPGVLYTHKGMQQVVYTNWNSKKLKKLGIISTSFKVNAKFIRENIVIPKETSNTGLLYPFPPDELTACPVCGGYECGVKRITDIFKQ